MNLKNTIFEFHLPPHTLQQIDSPGRIMKCFIFFPIYILFSRFNHKFSHQYNLFSGITLVTRLVHQKALKFAKIHCGMLHLLVDKEYLLS